MLEVPHRLGWVNPLWPPPRLRHWSLRLKTRTVPPRSYSRDEVQAILSRALHGQGHGDGTAETDQLSHEELLAIGRELGIADQAITTAAAGIGDELAVKRAVDDTIRRERRAFTSHLLSFILVNALLAAINLTVGGPLWFLWSVFGWGIGLTFHARAALLPDRDRLSERARKKLERERERDEKRARRDRGGGKRIEAAVQDVVAETLGAVADAISESRRPRPTERRVGVRVERGVRVDSARAQSSSDDREEELADERAESTRRRSR